MHNNNKVKISEKIAIAQEILQHPSDFFSVGAGGEDEFAGLGDGAVLVEGGRFALDGAEEVSKEDREEAGRCGSAFSSGIAED
jgi:hypothetical protein